MAEQKKPSLAPIVLLLGLWYLLNGGGLPSVIAPSGVTAVHYFLEKDKDAPRSPILSALDKLNSKGVVANMVEVDTKDGTGEVPEQYKVSLPAAIEKGIPAVVALSGSKVSKVLSGQATEEEVLGLSP